MIILVSSFMIIMTCMSYIDIKEKKIPMKWFVVLLGIAGIAAIFSNEAMWPDIAWGILPGAGLIMLAWLTRQIGYGDGLALVAVGLLWGLADCIGMLAIGLLLCLFAAIILLIIHKVTRKSKLPFLPFMEAGILIWKGMEWLWSVKTLI